MQFHTINPATGKRLKTYQGQTSKQVEALLESTFQAQRKWKQVPLSKRIVLMRKLAKILTANKEKYARLIALEMGKPFPQAISEIEKCAATALYFCEKAPEFLKNQIVKTEAQKAYVTFQPIGVILGIMPWNFPFWQALRCAIPSILAGNAFLLKHAAGVFGASLEMQTLFQKAGFPKNLFTSLICGHDEVPKLIEDPRIQGVTLTGSVRAGSLVAAMSGKALKKTVMELGGSDAFVVLADADLKKAIDLAVSSRLMNAGQSCIAAKRFVVVKSKMKAFQNALYERLNSIRLGDPLDPKTQMGPVAREDLRNELHKQVEASVAKGAKLLFGGIIPKGPGSFYPPTLLTNVKPGIPAYHQELFGPVWTLIEARDEKHALEIANSTEFGLGATVLTKNIKKGERLAAEVLEAGQCYVNGVVRSHPKLPFGGIKKSGFGRELSHFGILEFTNIKAVVLA